jgi:hypothetical protein
MTERPKVHAWKACVLFPGTEGSNPSLSVSPLVPTSGSALFIIAQPRQDRKVAAVSDG